MFNKAYVKTKKFIIENHNFLLFLILLFIVLNIKLPYIVERPGGLINLNNQIKINNKKISGNYNSSYVAVNDGTVVSVLLSYIMPNWDLVKTEDIKESDDMDYEDVLTIDKLSMSESQNTAIMFVFNKLSIPYTVLKENLYVYHKLDDFDNNLKYSDRIIKCNGDDVNFFNDLTKCINEDLDDEVDLVVKRSNKEVKVHARSKLYEGKKIIGIGVFREVEFKSDFDITFDNDASESGPSAGFMTALALYDNLSKENLSGNLKIAGTGTIDYYGNVGEIDGIKYKLLGAEKSKADIYFVPNANYNEALKIKKKLKLKLNIVKVSNFDDAINYLKGIKK